MVSVVRLPFAPIFHRLIFPHLYLSHTSSSFSFSQQYVSLTRSFLSGIIAPSFPAATLLIFLVASLTAWESREEVSQTRSWGFWEISLPLLPPPSSSYSSNSNFSLYYFVPFCSAPTLPKGGQVM